MYIHLLGWIYLCTKIYANQFSREKQTDRLISFRLYIISYKYRCGVFHYISNVPIYYVIYSFGVLYGKIFYILLFSVPVQKGNLFISYYLILPLDTI